MCGKKVPKTQKVMIDGAILNVCDECAKFGTPVIKKNEYRHVDSIKVSMPEKHDPVYVPKPAKPRPRRNDDNMEIVEDYAELIKNARERLAMSQTDLASKIFERKNVISSIERGDLMPDIKTARKLEKILGIKLLEAE